MIEVGVAETLAIGLAAVSGWLLAGPGVASRRLALLAATVDREGPSPSQAISDRLHRLRAPRVGARQRAGATIELCDGLAAELRAGRDPMEALRRAIEVTSPGFAQEMEPMIAAVGAGVDAPTALRQAGARPGAAGLRRLGVCYRIGAGAGGAFAAAVERLGAALRDDEAVRQEVDAQLAGARATARLLAALPFLGVLLGLGLGVDPFAFWFGGPVGIGCLVLGLAFDVLGLLWMRRLTRRAEAAVR